MNKFGFGKQPKENKDLKNAEDRVQAALEKAKACIHSDAFKGVVAEYEESERVCIETLYKYSKEECDNEVFGKIAKQLLLQLGMIRAFINKATKEAGEFYGSKR